jgi:hypothetical protein
MKSFLAIALVLAFAGAANAMPMNTLPQSSNVIQVAGGCGEGWHRGPHGGCLRNYPRPWRHACPRGYHMGPYGHCRANY